MNALVRFVSAKAWPPVRTMRAEERLSTDHEATLQRKVGTRQLAEVGALATGEPDVMPAEIGERDDRACTDERHRTLHLLSVPTAS